MNKKLKIVLKILVVLLLLFIIFIMVSLIVHKLKLNKECKYLSDKGFINLVNVGDYNLNIYKYGNESSSHKIIGLSGRGVNNYSIEMKYALEGLENDNLIVFVDRAGYGYSDDTKIKQSVKQVVEDYRTALKNSGIETPYILMPHSLGGIYATYWVSMYPEEIESVIFIDTTEIGKDVWEKEDYSVTMSNKVELLLSKLGLQRLALNKFFYSLPPIYSEEDQKITDYLDIKSATTKALLSELKETNNNTNYVFDNIVKNDVPKIYISSSNGFTTVDELKEQNEWIRNRKKELGLKVNNNPIGEDKLKGALKQYEEWRNTRIVPYLEKMGNTKMVLLPGDHMIFEQKPKELNKMIKDFIDGL